MKLFRKENDPSLSHLLQLRVLEQLPTGQLFWHHTYDFFSAVLVVKRAFWRKPHHDTTMA